jgi:hypothetical protein
MEGNILYKEYIELQRALGYVLEEYPNSKAHFDFNRAPLARSAYEKFKKGLPISNLEHKSFLVKAIMPKSGEELTEDEFNRLLSEFGLGVVKISMVDSNLLHWLKNAQKDEKILITGGACALETRDTKLIYALQNIANNKDVAKEFVRGLLSNFPTWTQITGTLIPSAKISVMYDETFPWYLKISEYGVENAKQETQKVYDKIFQGVQRYAKLYNPENIVLRVPFTSLNLKKDGYLDNWFNITKKYNKEIREAHNLSKVKDDFENFIKSWVEYTYFGPSILEIVKKNLKESFEKIYSDNNLENVTIHLRTKQIDHLDTERVRSWSHYVILENNLPEKLKGRSKPLFTNNGVNTIGLYNWIRDEYENNRQLGFVGFLDQNLKGNFMHEDSIRGKSKIKKAAVESLDLVFASPLRLTQKNVEESIRFLERFKSPYSASFYKEALLNLTGIKKELRKLKNKTATLEKLTLSIIYFQNLIEKILNKKDNAVSSFKPEGDIAEYCRIIIDRFEGDLKKKKFVKNELGLVFNKEFVSKFIFKLISLQEKFDVGSKNNINSKFIEFFYRFLTKEKERYCGDIKNMNIRILTLNNQLKNIHQNISDNASDLQSDQYSSFVDILPLGANLFVSYIQQLLFIPSIRLAFINLVDVEKRADLKKEQKEEKVIMIINKIFPVVEKCIRYIMSGGDYPWKERFEYKFEPIK